MILCLQKIAIYLIDPSFMSTSTYHQVEAALLTNFKYDHCMLESQGNFQQSHYEIIPCCLPSPFGFNCPV
jgi:hypothetical protein